MERYAAAAGLPEDRRGAHLLLHIFCTILAERGVPINVIRKPAGNEDIRATNIYTANCDEQLEDAILADADSAPLTQRVREAEPCAG